MHSAEAFKEVAFVGGTCLRLVHGLHRFSEDLDFSAQTPGKLEIADWMRHVERHLGDCDLADVEVTGRNAGAVVSSVWVKFPSLLNELGASAMPTQKLGIKLEFDANPPGGATFERHIVSSPRLMALTTHDLSSLMAGKLHAILARPYTKGRDWYDLVWYLGRRTEPNIPMLDAALAQIASPWCKVAKDWRAALSSVVQAANWSEVRRDVGPFLEIAGEVKMLDQDVVGDLVEGR
ncbi:MAG: nucleotidyl transferase AbiEii/AbiGii toxin family protein [Chthoniobacterales bacterium]